MCRDGDLKSVECRTRSPRAKVSKPIKRHRAVPDPRPARIKQERALSPMRIKHEFVSHGDLNFGEAKLCTDMCTDDLLFLKWGTSISQSSSCSSSSYGAPTSLCDDKFEFQSEYSFRSMFDRTSDLTVDVCPCRCHLLHGYDIDLSRMDVIDICLGCECYERW